MSNVSTVFCFIYSKAVLLRKCYGQLGKSLKVNPKFPNNFYSHPGFGRSLPKGKSKREKEKLLGGKTRELEENK